METLQINDDYALAFGLSWFVLDPLESRHERITKLRDGGARWAAVFKRGRGGDENIGTTQELPNHGKKSKVLSGAAQLARLPLFEGKNVLMMLEDPGYNGNAGLVAVVTLINGNVSYDQILSPADAEVERNKFEDQCEQSNRKYVTCGTTSTIRAVSQPLTWHDLLPRKTGRFKRSHAVAVEPLKSPRASQFLAIAIIGAFLTFGAVTAYQKYEQHQQRKRALEAARRIDPNALYAVSTQAFLAQPVPLLKDAIVAVRKRVDVNTTFAGWKLTLVDCTVTQCELSWQRETGTFAEFTKQAPSDWHSITYSDNGTTITSAVSLEIPTSQLPSPDQWILRKDFQVQVVSEWQRYSDVQFTFALGKPQLEALPPGVAPEVLRKSPHAIHSSVWSVQPGAAWYFADGLAKAPEYVTFENLKITVSNSGPTFEAKGKVYVKS